MEAVQIKHSTRGASSRYRWSECPGSVSLCEGLPPKSNVHADLGTHAHTVASTILEDAYNEPSPKQAYFEMTEDPELLAAVKVYTDLIRKEALGANYHAIEKGFDMSGLYPGLFGTCDAVSWWLKDFKLTIYDYKHGSGHFVAVENNKQLLYYSIGALLESSFPVSAVELVVVQPRCPRGGEVIHRWSYPVTEVYGHIADLLEEVRRTEEPNAPLKEGSWCFFCPAVSFCPEKHRSRNNKAREQFSLIPIGEENKQNEKTKEG